LGKTAATIPVLDGEPGQELQLDTGWVGWLTLPGRKRRFRAWIFTAVRSRHRFVFPTFEGNDGARDRSLRGRVGILWRRLHSHHPG
jgi:hypothetical protein